MKGVHILKLWKKILIALLALAVVGIGLVFYEGYVFTKKMEPKIKTYVLLTKEEQDEYVITHMEKLFGNFLESEELQSYQDIMNNDPKVRQAGIDWGRSACATFIVDSEEIFSGLSSEDKAAYYTEKEEYQQRFYRFRTLLKQNQNIDSED